MSEKKAASRRKNNPTTLYKRAKKPKMIPKANNDLKQAIYDPQTNSFILKIDNIIKHQLKSDNITLSEVFDHFLT